MVLAGRSNVLRRAGAFLALVAFEIAAVVVLHRLGELPWLRIPLDDLEGWLQTSASEDVLAAVVRLIALGAAWWLLGSTALYVLARLSRIPNAVRAVERITLPSVRRLADQAIALTLATSIMSGGASAALISPAGLTAGRPEAAVATVDPLAAWTRVSALGYRPTPTTQDTPSYQPEAAGGPSAAGAAPEPGYQPEAAGTGSGGTGEGSRGAGTPATTSSTTTSSSSTTSTSRPPTTTSPPSSSTSTTPPSTTAPPTTAPPTTAASTTAPPAAAKPPPAGYVPRAAGAAPSSTRPPTPAPPAYRPGPAGRPPGQPAPLPEAPPDRATPGLHSVVEGDNLWTIARDHLAKVTRRRAGELSEREIARYWLDVVDANRAGLRSGDPDVIQPGEIIKLPPVTGRREP